MRVIGHENWETLNEYATKSNYMAINLGMMTGCGACGDVTDQAKCVFCSICPRTNKCRFLKFDEYCDNLNAQKLAREISPVSKNTGTEKTDNPPKKNIEKTMVALEDKDWCNLMDIKPDLNNKAVNLGMMTGCGAASDTTDQEKCSFCTTNSSTTKCTSLRFGEYCDNLEAQRYARIN